MRTPGVIWKQARYKYPIRLWNASIQKEKQHPQKVTKSSLKATFKARKPRDRKY